MVKFSIAGSPLHQICTLCDPKSHQFPVSRKGLIPLTRFRKGHNISNVSHKNPALELESVVLVPDSRTRRSCLVLFILALIGGYLLAAEQNRLE